MLDKVQILELFGGIARVLAITRLYRRGLQSSGSSTEKSRALYNGSL